jgi:hypothetical protein
VPEETVEHRAYSTTYNSQMAGHNLKKLIIGLGVAHEYDGRPVYKRDKTSE